MSEEYRIQEYILSGREDMVVLPDVIQFEGAKFDQALDDLVIYGENGDRVFVRGFFAQMKLPSLLSDSGDLMSGELAAAFVLLSPRAVSALMEIDKDHKNQFDSAS